MIKGRTMKPCPACHEKPDWQGRPVDGVCEYCEKKLADYHAMKAAAETRTSQGMEAIILPNARSLHWFPTFYMGIGTGSHSSDKESRPRMARTIAQLAYVCSEPDPGDATPRQDRKRLTHKHFSIFGKNKRQHDSSNSGWQGLDVPRLMHPMAAELIRDLYDAISDALVETHDAAKREGQNVLLQLATGELSVGDFNKATEASHD